LLRGLAREQQHWGEFPQWLHTLPGCGDVVSLDLPGAGTQWRRRSPLSIAGITDDVRARLPSNKGPWVVIALSLGAMVALDWCSRYPHDFTFAVLVNATARGCCPLWQRLRWRAVIALSRMAFYSVERRESAVYQLTTALHHDQAAIAQHWLAIYRQHPVHRINIVRQLFAAGRFRVPVGSMRTPALVLASKKDGLAHFSCSENMAQQLDAPLELHEHAGHDLPLDDPRWIVDRLKKYISIRSC